MDRFAYSVESLDDLAPPVKAVLDAHLMPGEAIQQIVFAPRQVHLRGREGLKTRFGARVLWQRTPDWVLALTDERLLTVTIPRDPGPPQMSLTPLASVLWLELGTVLLYSWFEWSSVEAGRPRSQRVYFNTVSDYLFWPMLNAMRRTIIAQAGLTLFTGESSPQAYDALPFKFKNLIPYRLMLSDESAQALVYQPAIWDRHWGLFRRRYAPTTVAVLSPAHLLVAKEDLSEDTSNYGLIARYCPRSCLRRAWLERTGDDLWLSVTLGSRNAEDVLRVLFAPSTEPALEGFLTHL
jgi:hypothetical protein